MLCYAIYTAGRVHQLPIAVRTAWPSDDDYEADSWLCEKPIISTAWTDANSIISPGLKVIISPAGYIYATV